MPWKVASLLLQWTLIYVLINKYVENKCPEKLLHYYYNGP